MRGKVYIAGAGPGDPGLISLKALEALKAADVIVYDRLVHPELLKHADRQAELIYVGKEAGQHTLNQESINRLLVEKALQGKIVIRLKGGDPFVFGRGSEEALALVSAGIDFVIIPGISSSVAAPAYAGIPLTHRGLASSFAVITGHEDPTKGTSSIDWGKISDAADTLVFLMGVENLERIVGNLLANGRSMETPVALVQWGTYCSQAVVTGTLQNIVAIVSEAGMKSPAVTIVGEVVKLREHLSWFDNRPLFGRKILVTRSQQQSSSLSKLIREQGAEAVEFPLIQIMPLENYSELDHSLNSAQSYDWIIFTSVNAVEAVVERLFALGTDVRRLGDARIGAIGSKTALALTNLGLRVDYYPEAFDSTAFVDQFPEVPSNKKFLLPGAEQAGRTISDALANAGAQVDSVAAYKNCIECSDTGQVRKLLEDNELDAITFTSSSTVKNFLSLLGVLPAEGRPAIACIGPVTAETARESGMPADIMAAECTIESLVDSLENYFSKREEGGIRA